MRSHAHQFPPPPAGEVSSSPVSGDDDEGGNSTRLIIRSRRPRLVLNQPARRRRGLSTMSMLARRTAHRLVLVTVRRVGLWPSAAIVETWFGGIAEWPSAGAAGQVDRRDRLFLQPPSNLHFEVVGDLLHWRPDKIRIRQRVVQCLRLLAHLVPLIAHDRARFGSVPTKSRG